MMRQHDPTPLLAPPQWGRVTAGSGETPRADALHVSGDAAALRSWATQGVRAPLVVAELTSPLLDSTGLVTELLAAGVVELRVKRPVVLSQAAEGRDLAAVALVRDATAAGLPVAWTALEAEDALPQLLHLAPPTTPGSAVGAEWAARHRTPLLQLRRGPGFATVKDVRHPELAARYVLYDPQMLELVELLAAVVPLVTLQPALRPHLEDLHEAGLVLLRSGYATLLPLRMRLAPIPSV